MNEPVAIVFFPERPGITPAIEAWQARNPAWRQLLEQIIVCPVCGITVRAIADFALLDQEGVQSEIRRYQEEYLRAACSDHYYPTDQYWTVLAPHER